MSKCDNWTGVFSSDKYWFYICLSISPLYIQVNFISWTSVWGIYWLTDSSTLTHNVGWLCWGLTSQSTIFQSCRDGAIASWVINQYFRGVKCLAQGHNTAAVGLEPRTSRSGVRHSTTEPPRSPTHNVVNRKDNNGFVLTQTKIAVYGRLWSLGNQYNVGSFSCFSLILTNIKSEMRSFKSNENIHKEEGGSYYVVLANKASSVTL